MTSGKPRPRCCEKTSSITLKKRKTNSSRRPNRLCPSRTSRYWENEWKPRKRAGKEAQRLALRRKRAARRKRVRNLALRKRHRRNQDRNPAARRAAARKAAVRKAAVRRVAVRRAAVKSPVPSRQRAASDPGPKNQQRRAAGKSILQFAQS